ncbi:MAG: ABC transporter permease [Puia sp.]|nr:ABC transporter permease [Puia sp.]
MFRNLFKSALRNIRKGGIFSIINITGLAMGLSVCLLIALFVGDEFSYDRYNEQADRIFRIVYEVRLNGNSLVSSLAPFPMGPTLVKEYPQIEKAVRIRYQGDVWVRKGDEKELETRMVFADSTLFGVFSLPMIAGDPRSALVEPYSVVVTERIAKKYFNTTEVLGKTLVTESENMDTTVYKITGVIKDMPAASHFHFDFIKSMSERKMTGDRDRYWLNPSCATYLLAKPGVIPKEIDRMLASTVAKYVAPQIRKQQNGNLEEMAKHGDYFREYSIPLTRIHLYSNVSREFEPNGSIGTVSVFMAIAVFILLIACTNFMNLSTARSADRALEVGVRKVLGSSRRELVAGFLAESILTSLLAMLLAILITALLLPYFNRLSGKDFSIVVLAKKGVLLFFLLVPGVIGLLAGSYPAFYLSAFKPAQVLKGRLSIGFKSGGFRNALVVFQFVTAISLIIGTLVIDGQLRYIRSRDPGFNRDQVLIVDNTNNLGEQAAIFRDEAGSLPGVAGVTMTGSLPNRPHGGFITFYKDPAAKTDKAFLLQRWFIDAQYVPVLGMRMASGRNFSPAMPTDSSGVLINETAARLLGLTDPIGKMIYRGTDSADAFHILGVIRDFNGETMHDPIEPVVFQLAEDRHAVSFRVHTKDIAGVIIAIRDRYRSLGKSAGQPFVYHFMDDEFNKLYEADRRTGGIFLSFAIFAIFIACLGLFGLVTYAAEKRTKEIGIRKILGASVGQIVKLLSVDFCRLVMLAAIIASPVAAWAMHKWLEGFAYRIGIAWWMFLLAGALAGLITILTVSFRAMRAATVNPVKSLRTE